MQIVIAVISGLIFGLGLILSGMTDPAKVIGFLDLSGAWDPSLALVMAGAVSVGLVTFRLAGKRPASLLGDAMRVPTARDINGRLVLGSLTFGVGWGLAGYCPGPALASLATGRLEPVILTVAMFIGMALFEVLERIGLFPNKL